jgi:hypothetical protein
LAPGILPVLLQKVVLVSADVVAAREYVWQQYGNESLRRKMAPDGAVLCSQGGRLRSWSGGGGARYETPLDRVVSVCRITK